VRRPCAPEAGSLGRSAPRPLFLLCLRLEPPHHLNGTVLVHGQADDLSGAVVHGPVAGAAVGLDNVGVGFNAPLYLTGSGLASGRIVAAKHDAPPNILTSAAVQGIMGSGGAAFGVPCWGSTCDLRGSCVDPFHMPVRCQTYLAQLLLSTIIDMAESLTFLAATDRLAAIGITLGAVAEAFGVRRETVSRWRREGGAFPPPAEWRAVLAQLAETKGEDLQGIARELRAGDTRG
jgi:hypothetical protein